MTSRILSAFILISALLPQTVSAATFVNTRALVVSEPPVDNLYLAGTDVTVAAPLPGDVTAAGGTLTIAAPVTGDAALAGGTISIERPVAGDVRAVGAYVSVTTAVTGDLILAGGTVLASSTAHDTRIIGATVRANGSGGNVVIYGGEVHLSGTFQGNVEVVASDRLTLAENTVIGGGLRYDAPQEAGIPDSAQIVEGVTYTGASSYLPTIEEAQTFAIAGAGIFYVVRILAVLILAALVAGLFPLFSQKVADRMLAKSPGSFVLHALLGFAVIVAAPVLIIILLASFVGAGVALFLIPLYMLLGIGGYVFAGIVLGATVGRRFFKRTGITWRFALLGMLILTILGSVPFVGKILVLVCFLAATGTLVAIAYKFAFGVFTEDPLLND